MTIFTFLCPYFWKPTILEDLGAKIFLTEGIKPLHKFFAQ